MTVEDWSYAPVLMGLAELSPDLDLESALRIASGRSDLLPPRVDRGVGGEVASRFHEALKHRLEADGYRPSRAYVVPVPKPGHTTRPAAVMTLEDRTVYEALVARLAERIEGHLLSREVVYAHRATERRRPWREFEQAPLAHDPKYVVRADVFGYYETIHHEGLVDRLVSITGDREAAQAIGDLLGAVLGAPRGLPQGTRASDVLATAYFDPVDRAMLRLGLSYVRYGDDVRIAIPSYSKGREAVARLESSVRALGLALNGAKTMVLRVETYRRQVEDAEEAREELKRRLHEARVAALEVQLEEAETFEELEGVLTDDLLWGLYSEDVTMEDVVAEMRPLLEPDITEVAEGLFRDTMARAPWSENPLRREGFHGRFRRSLTLLTAAESTAAMEHIERILYRLPDETEDVAHYLNAVASVNVAPVQNVVEAFILDRGFRHDWQEAWLYDVLTRCLPLGEKAIAHIEQVAQDENSGWLLRSAAVVLLARTGRGDRMLLARMWELAPAAFRSEVIAAAAWLADDPEWAKFLEGCRGDPVHEVVVTHVREARKQRASQRGSVDLDLF